MTFKDRKEEYIFAAIQAKYKALAADMARDADMLRQLAWPTSASILVDALGEVMKFNDFASEFPVIEEQKKC